MKQIHTLAAMLLLLIMFATSKANAQVQLYSNDVCGKGTFQMTVDRSGGFNPGNAGENQTWDFRKLKNQSPFTFKIVPYNGQANGNEADMARINGKDTYSLYQKSGDDIFEVMPLQAFDQVQYKKLKTYHFPLAYNSVLNDSFIAIGTFTGSAIGLFSYDSVRIIYKLVYLSKVDGWGTLQLPGGDFNALRIRSETIAMLRVEGKTDTSAAYEPIHDYDDDETATEYNWYGQGKGHYLASYNVEDDEMRYMTSSLLSTPEVAVCKDIVFANPLVDETIVGNTGDDDYLLSVYDINGKLLYTLKMHGHSQANMNTSGWSAGVYHMQILNLHNQELVSRKMLK